MSLDNIEFSRAAWKRLQTAFNVTQRPVSLFIGPSADAAAASKTLRRLLQSYLIRSEIHIVENMDSAFELIKRRAETYLADQQFLGVSDISTQQQQTHQIDSTKEVAIFLGCGADRDLIQEMDWSALTEIHVIDNCRPVNLNLMRHAVASAQFLGSISDNLVVGSFPRQQKKPERCVFLWEQASAEAEIDEFFWRLEIASRQSNNFHLGRRDESAAGGGIAGQRRQRNEKNGQQPISSNNNNNNASATKQQEKKTKNSQQQQNQKSVAKKHDDGGDDVFDIIDEMEGKKPTTLKTNNNGRNNNNNSEDAALKNQKFSDDDDEDHDYDEDDDMSSERSVDDDDEEDEDFIQGDDESLGSRSDSDDEDALLQGKKSKKNNHKKNKNSTKETNKSNKKKSNKDLDEEEEQQLLGTQSQQQEKKSSKKSKKNNNRNGGEDEAVNEDDNEDDDDWLANSDEDEDEEDSSSSSDDDEENNEDDGETVTNTQTNNNNNGSSQNDAMTGDDWSSVFTGGRLSSRQYGGRSSKKNKNNNKKSKNNNQGKENKNDDAEDDDESYHDDEDSDDQDETDDDDYNESNDDEEDEDLLNRMDPEVAGVWRNSGAISAQRERAYYSRYWSSRALGVILHELSVRLEQADPDFVWHAAIGLADLHQRGLISSASYEIEVRRLENAVSQFKNALKRTSHGLALLPDNMNGYNQHHLNNNNNQQQQVLAGAGIMNAAPSAMGASGKLTRVRPLRHIKLFMLRHGSLWNALWLDRHISAALGFHHISSGTARLEGLLAKIGMPRHEAELPWNSIASEKREAVLQLLYSELRPLVADFDSGLYVPTLAKQVGYDSPVSAFDACNVFYGCIGAQPQQHHISIQQQMSRNNNNNHNQNLPNNNNLILDEYRAWQEDDYRRRFEAGVAVMSETPEAPLFQHAVNSAFELQAAAADATASILSGAGGGGAASLASTQHVRYVTIPLDHRIASIDHFAVPGRLRALALFLSAFTHNYRKNTVYNRTDKDQRSAASSLRPLVIGVADAATSQLTNGNVVLGSVALVVAPALYQSSSSSTNASIVPSKVLSNYRAVQASLQMNSKFCGVHRDVVISTVIGADAIMEAGELLHLESVANSAIQQQHQQHAPFNAAAMFIN